MPEEKNEKEKKPENRNPQNKKTTDNTAQKKKDHRKFHHKKKPKPPAAPDGSKENAANSTPSAATQATPTAQRQTEKKEPKKPGDRRPPSNSRGGGAKPVDAKPVEQIKNYFGIEIGEPKNTTDWLEEDIGRYHRAVMAALGKSPVSPEGLLDLSEIWISTSLPLDLIIEVIQTQGLGENLGEVKSVIFQGRKIWPLPKPVEKDD